jgi:hypothetical protein
MQGEHFSSNVDRITLFCLLMVESLKEDTDQIGGGGDWGPVALERKLSLAVSILIS